MATTIQSTFSNLQVSISANLTYTLDAYEIQIQPASELTYTVVARCGVFTTTESFTASEMTLDPYGMCEAGYTLHGWLNTIIEDEAEIVISQRVPVALTLTSIDDNTLGYYAWLSTIAEMIAVQEASVAQEFTDALAAGDRYTVAEHEVPVLTVTAEEIKPVIDNAENASGIQL